jgi:hypothetical protein
MWKIKVFSTLDKMQEWINTHSNYQFVEVFINNGYAVEYRRLRRVY